MLNLYIKNVDHVLENDDFFIMFMKKLIKHCKNVEQVVEKC